MPSMAHDRPPRRQTAVTDTEVVLNRAGDHRSVSTTRAGAEDERSESESAGELELVNSLITEAVTSSGLFNSRFPTSDQVKQSAAAFPEYRHLSGERLSTIVISPGSIRLTAPWPVDGADDAKTRAHAHQVVQEDQVLSDEQLTLDDLDETEFVDDLDDEGLSTGTRDRISGWSRSSRARMTHRLSELDYAPMFTGGSVPAMLTLTYPGEWEVVAPTGAAVKRHLKRFYLRYESSWGQSLICVWKLEFQRRGAPHIHFLLVPPSGRAGDARRVRYEAAMLAWQAAGGGPGRPRWREAVGDGLSFREWCRATWADIVDHPDVDERIKHEKAGASVDYAEGMRCSDPQRLSGYFSKHGTYAAKEYQHDVPELWQADPENGPGRFWGYRGLRPLRASAAVSREDFLLLSRTLRRLAARRRYWDPVTQQHAWRKSMRWVSVPRRRVDIETGLHEPVFDASGAVVCDEHGEPVPKLRYRRALKPVQRFHIHGAGYLVVDNAPKLSGDLVRLLDVCGTGTDRNPPSRQDRR